MAAPIQESTPQASKFFSTPQNLLSASRTLSRIVQLNLTLPGPKEQRDRDEIIQTLQTIWDEAIHREDAKAIIAKGFESLTRKMYSIYQPELDAADTNKKLQRCFRRFYNDTYSVFTPPAVSSLAGLMGPTHLVQYSRGKESIERCVLKWTDWNEIHGNRIYDAISKSFMPDQPYSFGLFVPTTSCVDFTTSIHEDCSGDKTLLEEEVCVELQQNFQGITHAIAKGREISGEQLMIAERIKGENLLDYITTQYPSLPQEQKEKLFERLGRLFYLDLRLGYPDRAKVFDFDPDSTAYEVMPAPANLGNILVSSENPRKGPILFAIDNGLDLELVNNDEQRDQYLTFLSDFFASGQDPEKVLAVNIADSLRDAFSEIEDRRLIGQQIKGFEKDLKNFGVEAIKKGLQGMRKIFKNSLQPSWQEEKVLKTYLETNAPKLLVALDALITLPI